MRTHPGQEARQKSVRHRDAVKVRYTEARKMTIPGAKVDNEKQVKLKELA